MLQGLSYDSNVVQFYGSCVKDGKILLVLEYMEVRHILPCQTFHCLMLHRAPLWKCM